MQLLEVTDSHRARQFRDFPTTLYRHHPQWIAPLDEELEAVFAPRQNPNFGHGEAIRWLLVDEAGAVCGRVAAFINHSTAHTAPDLPTGGFGFFECVDEQAAANVLFDACRAWLAARGMAAMDGPINFGERDKFWGLLVEGFTEPNYGMFYHMPYYRQLFESYGFQVYFKQYTYRRDVAAPLHPNFARVAAQFAAEQPAYRFAHVNRRDLETMARDFHHVYNLAWANHSGVSAMSLDKARELIRKLQPVLDERLPWFAYYHDEPVAFFVSLPELNQIFKRVGRRLHLAGKLRFLWERRQYQRRQPKKMFGVIFGVVPAHQGKGVESALMVHAQREFLAANYSEIEMNWIGDFNPRMMAVTRSIGARVHKTHVTYRKLFDETAPFERCPIIR